MGFPFVDLPELLYAIHFHSDAILKHVLKLRVLTARLLREVRRMAPGNLDSSGSLGDKVEDSFMDGILIYFVLVVIMEER